MGATGRAGSREWQLSRTANCSGSFVARGVFRLAGKSVLWSYILVKSAVADWARGGHGTNARPPMAERAMDRSLHLQGRTSRHGGGAWLASSTPVYYSIAKGDHCAAGIGSKIFRFAFPAVVARPGPMIHAGFDLPPRLANDQAL